MRYNPNQHRGGLAIAESPLTRPAATLSQPLGEGRSIAINQTTGVIPVESSKVAGSPPATSNQQPATKPGGLKKISFAKPTKKEETKTEYPVFQGDEQTNQQVFEIAARIKTRADEIESLTGAQDTDKAELKMFVLPFYFQVNRGRSEPPSSIAIPSAAGEVLVTFQNRYKKLADESALIPILGDELENYFRQAFTLKINGEQLPVDRAQDIVNEIQEVLARHHATDALEISEEIKPVKTFHDQRHTVFTPEQNLALDAAAPIVAMIKTKGRGR